MTRQITPDDLFALEFLDSEWGFEEFTNYLELPGMFGLYDPNTEQFCLGIVVDDEYFIDRVRGADDEFLRIVQSSFSKLHIDTTLEPKNHRRILSLHDLGFELYANGRMKVRLTR